MSIVKLRNLFRFSMFILGLLFLSFLSFLFLNIGRWLVISDPLPERLDLIFTFAGEHVRVSYSKELTIRYPDTHWILSDYKNGYSRLLRKSNYDMSRVYIVDTCQNTVSEIDAMDDWIKNHEKLLHNKKQLSIGLVSSPYHMRRIQLMVRRHFKKQGIKFYYLPVPLKRYSWTDDMLQHWWNTSSVSRVVISEIQKIIYFILIS